MSMSDFTPLVYNEIEESHRPTLAEALVPFVAIVIFLGIGSGYLGLAPHGPLLWSIVFTGLFVWYRLGYDWEDIYSAAAAVSAWVSKQSSFYLLSMVSLQRGRVQAPFLE